MRYLVIGGSGFIGSHLLNVAKGLGRMAFGTWAHSSKEGLLRFNLESDRITDILASSPFPASEQLCVIICAVVSNMDRCLVEHARSYRINVTGIKQLIQDCLAREAKVIFLSTCFVFDGERGYYREEDPPCPVNEYAKQKVEVEEFLRQSSAGALIVRLEKVVSDRLNDGQLLAQWHDCLSRGKDIVCIRGSLLSPTYVGDVARALLVASDLDLRGVYHVANSEYFYRDELARQFCHVMQRPPRVVARPLDAFGFADRRALKSYLDGSRFVEATGFRFKPMSWVFRSFRQHVMAEEHKYAG